MIFEDVLYSAAATGISHTKLKQMSKRLSIKPTTTGMIILHPLLSSLSFLSNSVCNELSAATTNPKYSAN